jgi:hypothetical protein
MEMVPKHSCGARTDDICISQSLQTWRRCETFGLYSTNLKAYLSFSDLVSTTHIVLYSLVDLILWMLFSSEPRFN